MKNILLTINDSLLAAITRKVLSTAGKIVIDEDTTAFAYQPVGSRNRVLAQRIFVVDSDGDYMEVNASRNSDPIANASAQEVFEAFPGILQEIDPDSFDLLENRELPDDLD